MNFLHIKSRTITSAAFLLAVAALLSRVLGLLRDRMMAAQFGAGDELDIYFTAFRIPDLLYNIIIAGTISAAFVPVFISLYSRDKKQAWQTASNFLNTAAIFLIAAGAILFFIAPLLVPLIAPGFDAEKMAVTVNMTRIMFLSPLLLGISAILGGILHSFKRFLAYASAPLFYNLGIIFGAVALTEPFGVYGLAVGVVLGSFMHLLVQLPSVFFSGFRWQGIINLGNKNFRKIFFLMLPRSFGLAVFQLNLWVTTAIASLLPSGSISIFNLANHLQFFAIGIVGYSFSTAAMPSFAKAVSRDNARGFIRQFIQTVRAVLFFVMPLSVMMFVLRGHIVRLVLGSGEFSWDDTRLTAAVLGVFSFGIFAHSLIPTFSKAFYAMQNTKMPTFINSIGFLINMALALFFVFELPGNIRISSFVSGFLDMQGVENIALLGLPFAFSISGILNLFLLVFVLNRKLKEFSLVPMWVGGLKILFASIIAGFASYTALFAGERFINTTLVLGLFLQTVTSAVAGGVLYIIVMFLLRSPELSSLLAIFKRKLSAYPYEHYPNGREGGGAV